jgi:hypothetical protein
MLPLLSNCPCAALLQHERHCCHAAVVNTLLQHVGCCRCAATGECTAVTEQELKAELLLLLLLGMCTGAAGAEQHRYFGRRSCK